MIQSSACVNLSAPVALCRNRTLVTLELGTNSLTDACAQSLGDALKLNLKLEGLSLWQNEISGRGAQCLAEGLQVRSNTPADCMAFTLPPPPPPPPGEQKPAVAGAG